MSGYVYCTCRDCMEIAVGEINFAYCHGCEKAGCEPDAECSAASAYGGDEAEEPEPAECPVCNGPGVPLGTLGNLEHFRCRNCAADFNRSNPQWKPRKAAQS